VEAGAREAEAAAVRSDGGGSGERMDRKVLIN